MSALCKERETLLDDERMNFLIISDCKRSYYMHTTGVQPEQLEGVWKVVSNGIRGFLDYIKG